MTKEQEMLFEQSRLLFPGTKRGSQTEFDNFKKHKDWKNVLPLLKPAVERQIQWRLNSNGDFRPGWKNFRTWINRTCWEDEVTVAPVVVKETTAEIMARLKAEGQLDD